MLIVKLLGEYEILGLREKDSFGKWQVKKAQFQCTLNKNQPQI